MMTIDLLNFQSRKHFISPPLLFLERIGPSPAIYYETTSQTTLIVIRLFDFTVNQKSVTTAFADWLATNKKQ